MCEMVYRPGKKVHSIQRIGQASSLMLLAFYERLFFRGTKLDESFSYSFTRFSIMALSFGLAGSVTGFQ
jgi:hypothetical protein